MKSLYSYTQSDPVETVGKLLKEALIEEIEAWYHYKMSAAICPIKEICDLYNKIADDEMNDHAKWLIDTLHSLTIDINDILEIRDWDKITINHPYEKPHLDDGMHFVNVNVSINEEITNESNAIDTYDKLIAYIKNVIGTNNEFESILKKCKSIRDEEGEHLKMLQDKLYSINQ